MHTFTAFEKLLNFFFSDKKIVRFCMKNKLTPGGNSCPYVAYLASETYFSAGYQGHFNKSIMDEQNLSIWGTDISNK